jgi:SAM-dependent methyltransferase
MPVYQNRRDAEFYLARAKESSGTVLELGCGTGRVLLPIARAGIAVTGVDASELMLAKLKEKLDREARHVRDRVELHLGELTTFELGRKFPLITMPFRPFQHLLEVEDQTRCLGQVKKHVAPGGRLVFDMFNPDPRRLFDPVWLQESAPQVEFAMPDGRQVKLAERTAAFHRSRQVNDVEMIFYVTHPDGRTERLVHAFSFRYFFHYEVEHLLARCGFRVVQLCGDLDGSPFKDDSPEMIFTAELQ